MSNPIQTASLYLINTIFNLYIFVLVIRLILVWVGADRFNPIAQFVSKLTFPVVNPLRRLIPNIKGVETATVVLILLLETIKMLIIISLNYGFPTILGILLLAVADSIKMVLDTFFYAILFQAIMSFVQPNSSMYYVLTQFNYPIMRPFQRLVPPIGGIDISPIPALIFLQLLIILLANPLMNVGLGVAIG